MRENLLAAGKRESKNFYKYNRFPLPPTAGRLAYCRQACLLQAGLPTAGRFVGMTTGQY
ncbi:MAG: hypothetical protein NTX22_00505 [Ignavibacteriales bacterium]|nr:hypothetical protein [Ignavibacteriales bacterium]